MRPVWFIHCHSCPLVLQASTLTAKQGRDLLVPTLWGDLCQPSKSSSCMCTSSGLQAFSSAQWYIPIIRIWIDLFFFLFKLFMLLHLPSLLLWACLFLYLAKLTRDEIGAEDVNYVIMWAKTYCVMGRKEKWQRPYMRKLNPMLGFWLRFWFLLCCQWSLVTSNVKVKSFISCFHSFKYAPVRLLYSHISWGVYQQIKIWQAGFSSRKSCLKKTVKWNEKDRMTLSGI